MVYIQLAKYSNSIEDFSNKKEKEYCKIILKYICQSKLGKATVRREKFNREIIVITHKKEFN